VLVDHPASAARAKLVLAHSAGAGMATAFMTQLASGLAERAIEVVRFEFPFLRRPRRDGRRGAPDRMAVLEASFREIVERVRDDKPLFLAGKSLGSRVAVHIADSLSARGVLAFGYPFHPPKRPTQLRVAPLLELRAPCLIVQGTRDPFGTPEQIASYGLPAAVQVHWLADGDHSFEPRKLSGRSAAQNLNEAIERAAEFVLERA
jgi:predicted alpha/beta-hydrolase family hydrolase